MYVDAFLIILLSSIAFRLIASDARNSSLCFSPSHKLMKMTITNIHVPGQRVDQCHRPPTAGTSVASRTAAAVVVLVLILESVLVPCRGQEDDKSASAASWGRTTLPWTHGGYTTTTGSNQCNVNLPKPPPKNQRPELPNNSVMFVQTAASGWLNSKPQNTLTLQRASASTTWFTNRPVRDAGSTSTCLFLNQIHGVDSNPLNAAITYNAGHGTAVDQVRELPVFVFTLYQMTLAHMFVQKLL
eukprot:gene11217-11365_t